MKRGERGQTTLEAVLCLVPFAFLVCVAGLVLWKGLEARIREHARFREARHALERRLR